MLALLLWGATACGSLSGETTAAAIMSAPPAPQAAVTYTVETSEVKDSAAVENGTVLASCQYEVPELHAFRADGTEITEAKNESEKQAAEAVSSFSERFSEWAKGTDFAEISGWAKEDYAARNGEGEWYPYDSQLAVTAWQTEHMVSVTGAYSNYTGGAHPYTAMLAWNFNLDTGAFIQPETLAKDEDQFRAAVTEEIIRQANLADDNGAVRADGYWEDYQKTAADWPTYAVSFDDSGMTVVFSQYELASYAAGIQSFTLSYDFLSPYLSERGLALLGLET